MSFTNLPSLWKGFKWKQEKQVVTTTLSLVGGREYWDERGERKERRKMYLTIHFQSIFKNLPFVGERNFCQTIQFLLNYQNHTSLFPPVGQITFACPFATAAQFLKSEEPCPLHFLLQERVVRLSVSRESELSDVPSSSSLQCSWIQGALCVNSKWLDARCLSLSHLQSPPWNGAHSNDN